MKQRRKILLLLAGLGLALVLGAWLLLIREPEPTYQGHKLSEYVKVNARAIDEEAIRHIGAKAVPHLLRWIENEEPSWAVRIAISLKERTGLQLLPESALEAPPPSWRAAMAFQHLGPEARAAIPELVRWLDDKRDLPRNGYASCALGEIVPDGIKILATRLTAQDPVLRIRALNGLGWGYANAEPVLSQIIQCVRDRDYRVRVCATRTLGVLRSQPALKTSALAEALTDAEPEVRLAAAFALKHLGNDGGPFLKKALSDPDLRVRNVATNALLEITAGALTNAPPR